METQARPVDTSSTPYNGPGAFPTGGAPPADKYLQSQPEYAQPTRPEDYPRPSREEDPPRKSDQYSIRQSQPAPPYITYGHPPPIPKVAVQPPVVEKMAGPAAYYPAPPSQAGTMAELPRPAAALQPITTTTQDIRSLKTSTQFAMREYLSLMRKRRPDGSSTMELEDQIRAQGRILVGDLKTLRKEVGVLIKEGENHRWRNWLIGGAVATFIPAVKRVFRRPSSSEGRSSIQASNNTEYAFSKSKAMLARIKDSVLGRNSFASIAFFVFAVLYIFSNEVSLMVAKTVSKRLKRLGAKIERGDVEVVDSDMKLLEGWRWRVLMWGQLSGNSLNFNDPHAVIALNSALLKEHFGLQVDLPADRLCPPIAQRHNYILWLKDLLDSTSYEQPDHRRVVGLDVGTDIDEKSISYAEQNVKLNNLQSYISVVRRSPEEKLVNPEGLGVDHLDFVMTNPPFYTSEEEVKECEQAKATEQDNHFTIAPNEQFTEGGEVAFVGRILEESLELREQVQWYTSMFGKKASLDAILEKLQEHKIDNFAVTEFIQGPNSKTKRWAVAWSFAAMRPSNKAARGLAAAQWRGILPPSTETEAWDREKLVGIGRAREDVWSRAWRRKKMREEREGKKPEDISTPEQCAFGFELALEVGAGRIKVICRWREGHSKPLYDSFCGFVKTKLSKSD
ncbi:hypothetical protein K4K54_004508 [Colletotrichum sp. SAR 10_86]|nr:hypothetical protein K4K52_009491 [Colletotrichum sp. SAR 10_76]KAI8236072.1 hypothetical protein K4K54_004508 [Colletotrichum sp. SAR 10_86]